jgi:hypothetical protein
MVYIFSSKILQSFVLGPITCLFLFCWKNRLDRIFRSRYCKRIPSATCNNTSLYQHSCELYSYKESLCGGIPCQSKQVNILDIFLSWVVFLFSILVLSLYTVRMSVFPSGNLETWAWKSWHDFLWRRLVVKCLRDYHEAKLPEV